MLTIKKDKSLDNCGQALVSIVARQSNTGFKVREIDESVVENGGAPILVEGVKGS